MGEIKRKKNLSPSIAVRIVGALSLTALLAPPVGLAQDGSRTRNMEGAIILGFLGGNEFRFAGSGLEVGLDRMTIFGFETGMRLTDILKVNMNVFFGTAKFYRTQNPFITMSSFQSGLFLGAEFHLLKAPITPVLLGGVGIIEFRNTGGEYFICMFKDALCLSSQWGIGLRLNLPSGFFVKALYQSFLTKYPDTTGSLAISGVIIRLGRGF